jgi:hypothetical protein
MKIDFEFETQYGVYQDALHFPDDQPIPSETEIELMKKERVDNWIAFIENPPPPPPMPSEPEAN